MTMEITEEEGDMFVSTFCYCEADLVAFCSGADKFSEDIVGLC